MPPYPAQCGFASSVDDPFLWTRTCATQHSTSSWKRSDLRGTFKMPVGSILQSLFVTAIGRAVPILYQKILRRRKVDAAIRGEATQNSAIKKALMDYEVIVGSTYGTLTETLDKFLRELKSSGVIVCMAEEAVVKRRTKSTRAAFLNLHTEVFGDLSGNAQALYEQIAVSFETSLELLIADPAIALLIKSLVQELSKRLDRIEECTSVLLLAKPSSDSQKDIVSTFHKVNRALATRYKDIRVETNRGARQVAIDRILHTFEAASHEDTAGS